MELNSGISIDVISVDLVVRLGMATLLGLLLGLDRELRRIPAGLRTHGLISLSAAAMTVFAIAFYNQFGGPASRMDPLRLIEGAGAFIGIVAAALVVTRKGDVHNLTTAVHLWLAAVVGIACGAGQWPLVLVTTLSAILLMTLLRTVETRWITPHLRDDDSAD